MQWLALDAELVSLNLSKAPIISLSKKLYAPFSRRGWFHIIYRAELFLSHQTKIV